jgi:hypothetical protein
MHHPEQKLDSIGAAAPGADGMLYIPEIAYKKNKGILFYDVLLVAFCLY